MQNKRRCGFTLIELSIVLVIIGLIVGGVLVGRDLISAAAVRAQVTQLQEYTTAVATFKGKYDCLPGDCLTASNYNLGANGNGNETLEASTITYASYTTPDGVFDGELPLFFIHLSAAKIIKGNFNGILQLGAGYPKLVVNDSFGMIAAGPWQSGNTGTDPNQLVTDYNFPLNGFWLYGEMCKGALTGVTPVFANDGCGVLTPAQAFNMDKKIDDGNPTSGRFWSYSSVTNTGCLLWPYTSYNTTYGNTACQFAYRLF